MRPLDRVDQFIVVLMMTGMVLGIGVWINYLRNRKGSLGFPRGERVLSWVVPCYFVCGLIGMFISDERTIFLAETGGAIGFIGVILGVIAGNIHASYIQDDFAQ